VRAERGLEAARDAPPALEAILQTLLDQLGAAEARRARAEDALALAEAGASEADRSSRSLEAALGRSREARAAAEARAEAAREAEAAAADNLRRALGEAPQTAAERLGLQAVAVPADAAGVEAHLAALERDRDAMGPVNLRAEEDALELAARLEAMAAERQDLQGAIGRLRAGVQDLNQEGRERLQQAFGVINGHFKALFETLFEGGQAELRLVENEDPLEAGLEIFACPPGKRLAAMSLMSGGEQALTAAALIFAVFLAAPSPVCVLDEVDAPLDDANVDRFCRLLDEMRRRTKTRFIVITHNPVTMSRVDRLFGVTMPERGISQLVSINLRQAEALAAE
jgi:chromosome segregation protein